jgi:hypothetical protein
VITEPHLEDVPNSQWDAHGMTDTLMAGSERSRHQPWRWGIGTTGLVSAAWALALHLTGYGDVLPPDLHHYHLTGSPCSGSTLKPLTDAFGSGFSSTFPVDTQTGPALDQAQCALSTQGSVGTTHWQASYTVTVTVQLHKETDPAPEFDDRNNPHELEHGTTTGADTSSRNAHIVIVDPSSGIPAPGQNKRVESVPSLGDRAYLLTGDDGDQTLTVLHGGAVFTLDVKVLEQWAGSRAMPPSDPNGHSEQPPSTGRLRPALIAAMHTLMSALSR